MRFFVKLNVIHSKLEIFLNPLKFFDALLETLKFSEI